MSQALELQLERVPDLVELGRAFPGQFPYLLDSSAVGPLSSCSLLLFAGTEFLLCPQDSDHLQKQHFFDQLKQRQAELKTDECSPGLPFAGGWFLYLGYEMVMGVEQALQLPASPHEFPDAIAHRCTGAIIIQHSQDDSRADVAWIVAEDDESMKAIRACLEAAALPLPLTDLPPLEALRVQEPQRYVESLKRIQHYLAAGDVFQVNVSRRWDGCYPEPVDPSTLYRSLQGANPAPFSGLVRWQSTTLMSSSPERLVSIRGDVVETRPIAGTRPRGLTREDDCALSSELIGNLKERAEHVMLIDLERNDLGRVCRPGSIEVDELMVVESYAHVHHIVSNVRGKLAAGCDAIDTLKAVFPGGTITGCPKIRCMEIIAELEGEGRGYYTGSMGYLGRDGRMDMNILIRSILLHGRDFNFRTGAGIVVDSDAEHELLETEAKARGLVLAVEKDQSEEKYARMPH